MRTDSAPSQPDAPALLATPPRGLALVVWVGLFLVLGSVGHDPWRGDDATHFGVIWSMLQSSPEAGAHLIPRIAGVPHLEYPPLFYWLGVLLAQTFGWLLAAPDAARLASGVFAAVMVSAVGRASRRWHGNAATAPAVLLSIGTLGLMVHAHESQPMMAVVAMAALGYLGFAKADRHPLRAALLLTLSLSGLFLAGGAVTCLLLLPLWALAPLVVPSLRQRASLAALLASLLGAGLIIGLYALGLHAVSPEIFTAAQQAELQKLALPANPLSRLSDWMRMLSWFAWPAWPLAGWALWQQRRHLDSPALRLPLLYLACALAVTVLFLESRSANALPLIAPLALLAIAGLPALRRGAANAFDWFGIMTFGVLGLFVWFAWNTLANGYPARFAATLARLEPGYEFQFSLPMIALSLALTLAWVWLVLNSPRSPWRGITHWTAGVILFWGLSASLLQPWVNEGKSYRPVVESLTRVLRTLPSGCMAGRELGTTQRTSLDYFAGIQTRSGADAERECKLLLIQTTRNTPDAAPPEPWERRWEGHRAGDRNERLRLYVRP